MTSEQSPHIALALFRHIRSRQTSLDTNLAQAYTENFGKLETMDKVMDDITEIIRSLTQLMNQNITDRERDGIQKLIFAQSEQYKIIEFKRSLVTLGAVKGGVA